MRVIGTAGHVDHGKSTLVEALTGTHPDRLKEEREREMTIDLGFAWVSLPGGEDVGIVDVPGHRDFIENMLAGVAGIDAALFVVAADEGVMPQTREHLAILDILQIQGGVVALTKTDLVSDEEWLDLVEEEVSQALAGTVLGGARIVRVSARTGAGVPDLLQALNECLSERPPRPDLGRPRLPVDRVFTISGFGTVVTGTLSDGCLKLGEEVEILPQGGRGRVRGLQTHKRKEEVAVPGSRTAVNISGVAVDQVRRGDVVAHPGDYKPSRRLDVFFRYLPDASQPLSHNTEVKLFLGAAEIIARLRLLGKDLLQPGEEAWLQLELRTPVATLRGDPYILRRPSPGETLGGGIVVDPHPKGRHKRFSEPVLAGLEALAQGDPEEVLLQALSTQGVLAVKELVERTSLELGSAVVALEALVDKGQVLLLEEAPARLAAGSDVLVTTPGYWGMISERSLREVEAFHRSSPLRRGMPREELKSRLKLPARLFNAVQRKMVGEGSLVEAGPLISVPGHQIRFSLQQEGRVRALLAQFAASPYAPPSVKEAQAAVGEEVYSALLDMGVLVGVSPEVVFRKEDYERMLEQVRGLFAQHGTLTAAQVRDHFNTSRRYVLAFLEHLDGVGITVRSGDVRRLRDGR
jgi:selenocysteine-specific elongation factor